MKIYISYTNADHGRIHRIESLDYWVARGMTEEQVDRAVAEQGKKAGWDCFRIMEVTGEMENVLRFLLGENEYKAQSNITNVYNTLRELQDDLESMHSDIFDTCEEVKSSVAKVKALVPVEYR